MSQFLIYQSEDGRTKLDVRLENQTLWLNQKQLTELFGKAKGTISEHIKHIFEDKELEPEATVRLSRTVQNKVHFAIHGQTAAEVIRSRADSRLPNMGLRRIPMTMGDWITKIEWKKGLGPFFGGSDKPRPPIPA